MNVEGTSRTSSADRHVAVPAQIEYASEMPAPRSAELVIVVLAVLVLACVNFAGTIAFLLHTSLTPNIRAYPHSIWPVLVGEVLLIVGAGLYLLKVRAAWLFCGVLVLVMVVEIYQLYRFADFGIARSRDIWQTTSRSILVVSTILEGTIVHVVCLILILRQLVLGTRSA